MHTKWIVKGVALVLVLAAACAKPPVEDMDNASAAVSRAESDADVAAFASSALARARDSLANMRAEAEAKRYDEAKRLATETIALAERAIQEARNAASSAREEAANAILIMDTALNDANTTIEGARGIHNSGVNFEEIDRDFMSAKAGADRARNANNEKRYHDAIDGSATVRAQVTNITSRIGQAAIATSRKK